MLDYLKKIVFKIPYCSVFLSTFPLLSGYSQIPAHLPFCCARIACRKQVPISWHSNIVSRVVLVLSIGKEETSPWFPAVVFHSWAPGSSSCVSRDVHSDWRTLSMVFSESHVSTGQSNHSMHKGNKSSNSGKHQIGSACSNWLHWTQAKPPGSYVGFTAFL